MKQITLTDYQYQNLLEFLTRSQMNGKEAIAYIELLQALRRAEDVQPE